MVQDRQVIWSLAAGDSMPPLTNGSEASYPAPPMMVVYFGGTNATGKYSSQTFENYVYLGSETWFNATVPGPSARAHAVLIWDPTLQGELLFGGIGPNGYLNDTWLYQRSTGWTQLSPPVSPSPRASAAAVYDPAIDGILLFGGVGPRGSLNDTWLFSGENWQRLNATGGPSPRSGSGMTYDQGDGVVYLFGGQGTGGLLNDTWGFHRGRWFELHPATSPSAREGFALASTGGGYPILFGGEGATGPLNGTWLFNAGDWTRLQVANGVAPPPREGAELAYDPNLGLNFFDLYGGVEQGTVLSDFWQLDVPFGGSPNGTAGLNVSLKAAPSSGTAPLTVSLVATVTGGPLPYTYVWNLGDGSPPPASVPSLSHVYSTPGSFRVTLEVVDALGTSQNASVLVTVAAAPTDYLALYGGPPVWIGAGLLAAVLALIVRRGLLDLRTSVRLRRTVGAPAPLLLRVGRWLRSIAKGGSPWGVVEEFRKLLAPKAHPPARRRLKRPYRLWLARRGLLLGPQLLLAATVLYALTEVIPNPTASAAFFTGWGTFTADLFTGRWGVVLSPLLVNNTHPPFAPAAVLIQYYFPYSLELALFSLLFASLLSYPLGLLSGWRKDSPVDQTTRVFTALGAFVPFVVIALYITDGLYTPFLHAFGDTPFGSLPSGSWFDVHMGGFPPWIGTFLQTSPTGFPLVDAALHQAWSVELLILAKMLLQSIAIGALYAAFFLRYARLAATEARTKGYVVAGRARGLSDRTLLWKHTSREALSVYVFTFGSTFSLFLLIQSLGEWFFGDTGLGAFLIDETFIHVSTPPGSPPGILAVLAFLVLVIILAVNVTADAISRALDPRLAEVRRR